MNFFLILLLQFNFFQNSHANLTDVTQVGSPEYIEVTLTKDQNVKFRYCNSQKKTCEPITNKTYSLNELRNQRAQETIEVVGSTLTDAAILAGAAYGGAYLITGGNIAGASISSSNVVVGFLEGIDSAFHMVGVAAGGFMGFSTGTLLIFASQNITNALNPLYQYEQTQTIQENVILDKNVPTENIRKFKQLLTEVLEKI